MKKLFYVALIVLMFAVVFTSYKTYSNAQEQFEAEEAQKEQIMKEKLETYLDQYEVEQLIETTSYRTPGKKVYIVVFGHNVDYAKMHVLYYDQKSFENEPTWHNYSFSSMDDEERAYYYAKIK